MMTGKMRMMAVGAAVLLTGMAHAAEDVAADVAALKALAASTTLVKEGDKAAGAGSYALCMACHMADGAGNPAMQSPRIAGLPIWYVAASVKKFKDGHRGAVAGDAFGAQMRAMSMAAPSDKGLADLAAYVNSLGAAPAPKTVTGDVEKGKATYAASCVSCHGADGSGSMDLLVPALGSLPDWYVVNQLTKFRNGQRGAHADDKTGAIMAKYAKTLADDQALKDVAAYIGTLTPAAK